MPKAQKGLIITVRRKSRTGSFFPPHNVSRIGTQILEETVKHNCVYTVTLEGHLGLLRLECNAVIYRDCPL